MSIIFCGCNNDKDKNKESAGKNDGIDKIEIVVENGNEFSNQIDQIKLEFIRDNRSVTLAEAEYNNGNITLFLPEKVSTSYLLELGDRFPSSIIVDKPNTQLANASIMGYKDNEPVCRLLFEKFDTEKKLYAIGHPIYLDNSLSVEGTETEINNTDITIIEERNNTYSINAVRGWNMFYEITKDKVITNTDVGTKTVYNYEMTTTDPEGLKWFIEFEYSNDGYVTAGQELKFDAQVENGNDYNNIKRVRVNGYNYPLATGTYSNGSFSLTIPNSLLYSNLIPIENFFNNYFSNTDLSISKTRARVISFDRVMGYSSSSGDWLNNDHVGDFYFCKIEPDYVTSICLFSNMDVSVTSTNSNNINLNLKAGWNTIYVTETTSGNRTISTNLVSGLKWYFQNDINNNNKTSFFFSNPTNNRLNSKEYKNRFLPLAH